MKSTFKTFILLAGLTALFGWAGYMLGGQGGMIVALVLAAVMNFFAYWNADKMVLKMYGAQPVETGWLINMVDDLARHADLPTPRVYIIDNEQPNAFATGRNPDHAAVAVTSGIINILDARELRGVIAHELTHIKNRDTLIMTVTATLAGALSTLAHFAVFFGAGGGQRNQSGGPLGMLILMILSPLIAMLVQFAISRTREYAADRGGAEISGDPLALAAALQKLDRQAGHIHNEVAESNPGTAHMFIVNPLSGRTMDNLFSTHPSTANRVAALNTFVRSLAHAH